MRITEVTAWQVDLPLKEGKYSWSGGKSVSVFDTTVVRIATDAGLSGHGESCPLGPVYLPSYAAGVRAGLAELGPHLIGADPTQLGPMNRLMDAKLKGHPYVKSAIDMACWDILGQVTGKSVCTLLGGRVGESVTLYRAISELRIIQAPVNSKSDQAARQTLRVPVKPCQPATPVSPDDALTQALARLGAGVFGRPIVS